MGEKVEKYSILSLNQHIRYTLKLHCFTLLSGMLSRLTRETDVVKSDPEKKPYRFHNNLDFMLWVEGYYV